MEEEIDLRVYVEVLIRSWKWVVGLALVAAVAAFAVSFLISPIYEAMALAAVTEPRYVMRFDPRFETVDSVQPAYKAYPELATSDDLLQELLTSPNLLSEGVETLQDLRGILEAKSGADPSMVQLVVSSQDPEEAARVANAWAALFVARANEIYGAHSEDQGRFFEDQLERTQAELEAAEQALIEFQARNQGAVLEAQLASAQQDLQDYLVEQREIERAVRNARALQTHVAGQPTDGPATPGDNLAALLLQIQAFSIRTSRPAQTADYERGGALSVWLQPESEAGSSIQLQISDAALLSSERTVGELMASLDELVLTLEAWEEEIETHVAALEPQILALQQQLQEIQTEEDGLTRARDVARETHTTLARKVEEARIATQDTTGEVRLASQAAVPEKPVSPRKLLNTAVAGMLGLMLGVFGAFAVEWWRGDEGTGREGGEGTG
ncbi:MAG: GumC family protein [Anaerolineae bacterium]